ncbi:MAG: hypothetical protein JNL08_02310 [Planctomycetes bacterium]|nr:hypothetical protein [Planctomycetota bacterium]
MRFHLSTLALAAALPLAAQTPCPMQTTLHVPDSVVYGPQQDCGGVSYQLPDLQIQLDGGTCPTFVVYVPPHDVAVAATTLTFVEVIGHQPITMIQFECQTKWLLILPIGSECAASKPRTIGTVPQLLARPCAAS